ncbi:hypothetical protein [Legionella sp. 31fI33]|uniref:hypothetical protein n=1 Tax=Legionella sp. 31fI33 TaxID=2886376 RepID=UPI001E3CEDED|nr:hypothetical protein [Legionella sp. 31fI33]MCC5016048.1 hypothetical protein [Legionella sp. 31fI33]
MAALPKETLRRIFNKIPFKCKCLSIISKAIWSLLKIFFVSILGYIAIAIFLNQLSNYDPGQYRSLTYWANQKGVPSLRSCKFKKIPFEAYKQFTWYTVEIELDRKGVGSAIIFPTREYLSIQEDKGPINLATAKDNPYLVLWKKNFGSKPLLVRIQSYNEYESFKEGVQYSYYDCPIKVEFIIDE